MTPDGARAATTLLVRLQVGRVLRGPLLLAASAVSAVVQLVLRFGFLDGDVEGPPAFVVVEERDGSGEVRRLAVGRDAAVAAVLLQRVQEDLEVMTRTQFLATWPPQSRLEQVDPRGSEG